MGGQPDHPASWRIFRAHPALGLEERAPVAPAPHELGVAWLALEPAEQRRRLSDCDAALRAAARPGSGFELELLEEGKVLGVVMDRWKAPALERLLLEHVAEQARRRRSAAAVVPAPERRRREAGRVLRANMVVAWSRHGSKVALAAFGVAVLLGWHPLGRGDWADVATRVGGTLIVLVATQMAIARWYRRAQREPE